MKKAALFLLLCFCADLAAADAPVWWSPRVAVIGDSYIYDTRLYWLTYFESVNVESKIPATPGKDGDYTFGQAGASYLDYDTSYVIAEGYNEICIFHFGQNDIIQDNATATQFKTRLEALVTELTVTNEICSIILVDYPSSLAWTHPTYTGDPTRQDDYALYSSKIDEVVAANPLVSTGVNCLTAEFAAFDDRTYHPNNAGDEWLVAQWALAVGRALDALAWAPLNAVPAGSFSMGSATGELQEAPVHSVTLDDFWIDRTPVTASAYEACVTAGSCAPAGTTSGCNAGVVGRENHPANCIDWVDAANYCTWAGMELPTEAQWENAARSDDGRTYPWGEEAATCSRAVMDDAAAAGIGCGNASTAAVGSKPSGDSPYGVKDMSGNVWEWVNDWYSAGYYAVSPASNPTGPATGTARVLRGGSWLSTAPDVRTTTRRGADPAQWNVDIGFRCATLVPEPSTMFLQGTALLVSMGLAAQSRRHG